MDRGIQCPIVTNRLFQILSFSEFEGDTRTEIQVTERSRNREAHGEEAVGRNHDESVETRKLSSKGRPLEGARRGLGSVKSGSRNRYRLYWCQGCLLLRNQQNHGIYRLRRRCQFLKILVLCLFKLFLVFPTFLYHKSPIC